MQPKTLYDYYSGKGQALPSVQQRAPIFESLGLGSASSYTGSAQQNTALLAKLAGGSSTAPTSTPTPTPISPTIQADQIQAPTQIDLPPGSAQSQFVTGLTSQVDTYRNQLEGTLGQRKAETDAKLESLRQKEKETLDKVEPLTQPFREELENTERERLFINKNFEENQTLIDELDQLLTEGNNLIKQQQDVTGLAAVRNPRIQKAMDDVSARAGVIEAVINARNGQIAQAQTLIDRTVGAITADRNDRISYYETILELNNRDILSLDKDSKAIAEEQLGLIKGDLERAQATADYVKQLLIDPATASLMGEAGVKLTDSIEEINGKVTEAQYARDVRELSNEMSLQGAQPVLSPAGIPTDRLVTLTDARGVNHYFKTKAEKVAVGTQTDRDRATLQQEKANMEQELQANAGPDDGKVSPDTWLQLMQGWVAENPGQEPEDFVKFFSRFVNTSHSQDYYLYDAVFKKKSKNSNENLF